MRKGEKMSRMIDADALKEAIANNAYVVDYSEDGYPIYGIYMLDIGQMINDAPTIEPERKNGKWDRHCISQHAFADQYWHCSECGFRGDFIVVRGDEDDNK